MRSAILAGAALALYGAAPASAMNLFYSCEGYAEDPSGGQLQAVLNVAADGTPDELQSIWLPPGNASPLVKGAAVFDADLAISSNGDGFVIISALAPPGARSPPAARFRELDGLRVTVSFDGGPETALAYADDVISDDLPLNASRTARVTMPAGTKEVRVILRNAKGAELRSVRFDLSDVAARERLLAAASAGARKAALDYKTCQKLG